MEKDNSNENNCHFDNPLDKEKTTTLGHTHFREKFVPLLLKNHQLQWLFSHVAYNLVVCNSRSLLESTWEL